jgi:hypothetical protein
MIRYAISGKCLRFKRRIKAKRELLADKKMKLKKIIRTNLRISSYITKISEQFLVNLKEDNKVLRDNTFMTSKL